MEQKSNLNSLDTIPNLYGLIGYPLSHSFSKKYFTEKYQRENILKHCYELFPLSDLQELSSLLQRYPNLKGLNVTIPYKELVFPFLDEVSEEAEQIGAVNTIKIEDGKLKGYNTDVYGFEHSLLNVCRKAPHMPNGALILGTGGAAKAIAFVLKKLKIDFTYVSRTPKAGQTTYQKIDQQLLRDHPLIINTTPLGTSPNEDTSPDLPYHLLNERNVLYDLVYNPEKTLFLKEGLAKHCQIKNGLEMLHLQAEKAWEIWKEI